MEIKDLAALMKSQKYPAACHHFKNAVKPPFIVYYEENGQIRGGDAKNCIIEQDFTVELYTDRLSEETETEVMRLLETLGVEYEWSRVWIESEKLYQTAFSFHTVEKRRAV